MSTRARVGLVLENGSVESIYCHHDGYLCCLGNILKNHYTTEEKIKKLLAIGDCSIIAEKVDPPEGVTHTFGNPYDDVCVAYGRDRGENNVDSIVHPSEKELMDYFKDSDQEYLYIFKDGKWLYAKRYGDNKFTFEELTDEAIEED